MPTAEELMMIFRAKDEVSNVTNSIDKNVKTMASSAQSAIINMSSAMTNFNAVSSNMLNSLAGKSANDLIFGTASKAETNKVLINNMTETEKAAESLFSTVDNVTNTSLTSMQDLIPAMNAFKSATGATDKEMENITDDMANFGAAVLAQTGSNELAAGAMMDLSKGVKGLFASLDQYGVSEEALKRTGLWSGKEDDVEGYMKAVTEVIGSTEELMETNQGVDALIGKSFSRAGKKIGNEFLPIIKDVKKGFIDLDNATGGNLAASVLVISESFEVLSGLGQSTSNIIQGVKDLTSAFYDIKEGASLATSKIKELITVSKSMDTVDNVSDTAELLGGFSPDDIKMGQMHGGAIDGGTNFLKGMDDDTLQDIIDYQIASADGNLSKMAILEEKYDDLDLSAVALKSESEIVSETMGEVSNTKGINNIVDSTEEIVGAGSGVGALAPEAAAASTEVEATATATASLSASFTAMIVPLLAISAVIAVMIPIAVALAAEALLALKAIQMVFEALDFGGIDLSEDINGIKQLAEGLAWVGAAMAALTLTNITTQLAAITSGFLGLTGPLKIAIDALKRSASLLKEFSGVTIDSSVPNNIKNIAESLNSVSNAMASLTALNITVGFSNFIAWAFNFGSVTSALSQAKTDLINASSAINELATGISPLDESKAKNIQNVCDSLASVGDAIGALRSLRDNQNWDSIMGSIFKGVDIQTALLTVKNDIVQASSALSGFTGISEIPEGISEKIKKVSDTLTSVSDAFTTLRALRDNNNWDEWMSGIFKGSDIASALEKIKTDLITASQKLAGLSAISEVNEDIITKIQQINNAVKKVSEVSNTLITLGNSGIAEFDSTVVSNAVTVIQTVATELAKLNGIAFDGGAANTILTSLQTTLTNVKNTLAAAAGFSEPAINIGSQIVVGVQTGLLPLPNTVVNSINNATNSGASAAWTGGAHIGNSTTNGFKSSLKLADVMTTEMGHVKSAVDSGISAAKSAAESGAREVVQAFKNGVEVGSPGAIARTMKQEMLYTKDFITGASSYLNHASNTLAKGIVNSFGNPSLNLGYGSLPTEYFGSIQTMVSSAPSKSDNRPVNIIIGEGAVQLDARNLTTNESKQIMINALEGLDSITDIVVSG